MQICQCVEEVCSLFTKEGTSDWITFCKIARVCKSARILPFKVPCVILMLFILFYHLDILLFLKGINVNNFLFTLFHLYYSFKNMMEIIIISYEKLIISWSDSKLSNCIMGSTYLPGLFLLLCVFSLVTAFIFYVSLTC